jgi:hypothetical protein
MSREVLENYLSRSISFTELLHDDLKQAKNARGVDPRGNIRFLTGSGASNFRSADIIYADGRSLGGIPTVPDMSRLEARMWYFFPPKPSPSA